MDAGAIERILVTAATGKTGRRVADRLEEMGYEVRRGSRRAGVAFDWQDSGTWAAALAGMDAAYVVYSPDLAVPEAPEAMRLFGRMAAEAGVRRLVLLSGRGEAEAQKSERIIAEAGPEWTVVRASWFNQNFSEGAFVEQVLGGTVALPVGDVREPFIDVDDIADVAVAALTEDGHAGKVYEVTGPELLTFAEAVAVIAEVTGRDVGFVEISGEAFREGLEAQRVPSGMIGLLEFLFTEVLDGRNASVAHGVREALGRGPGRFEDYVKRVAAEGAWGEAVAS